MGRGGAGNGRKQTLSPVLSRQAIFNYATRCFIIQKVSGVSSERCPVSPRGAGPSPCQCLWTAGQHQEISDHCSTWPLSQLVGRIHYLLCWAGCAHKPGGREALNSARDGMLLCLSECGSAAHRAARGSMPPGRVGSSPRPASLPTSLVPPELAAPIP